MTLVLTTLVAPAIYCSTRITWLVCGPLLVAIFGVYFILIALAIGRGVLTAPEDSDDSDDDDASSVRSTTGLLADNSSINARQPPNHHRLGYHGFYLCFGFLAICLAGYVISQAAINITDQLGISDVLFSVIIIAIATTLPEKFIAVMSGYRGHPGILVANCAGSNIFLLSLCCGIIMIDTEGALNGGNVTIPELAVLWASTAAFTATVWFGARFSRWIGGAMVVGYIAFILLEFTVIHGVAG